MTLLNTWRCASEGALQQPWICSFLSLKKMDWKPKVYHPKAVESKKFKTTNWFNTRDYVFNRDGYCCQMCKESLNDLTLSIHHIKPRKKGGTNHPKNLISLCVRCHDIAEEYEMSKRSMLQYWANQRATRPKSNGVRWQQWVYGGYKRPN